MSQVLIGSCLTDQARIPFKNKMADIGKLIDVCVHVKTGNGLRQSVSASQSIPGGATRRKRVANGSAEKALSQSIGKTEKSS